MHRSDRRRRRFPAAREAYAEAYAARGTLSASGRTALLAGRALLSLDTGDRREAQQRYAELRSVLWDAGRTLDVARLDAFLASRNLRVADGGGSVP